MKHIAKIYTDFPTKFGIPRQSGLVEELKGQVIFEKEYRNREAFRGLEEFSHIWLLWEFSEAKRKHDDQRETHIQETHIQNEVKCNKQYEKGHDKENEISWFPTVRPPKLGGNERMGVFATRSPFRPNPIGLSCVKLEKIEFTKNNGPILHVAGADLMDGTPIYDIKPYLPYADAKSEATCGFTVRTESGVREVEIPDELLIKIPEDKIIPLTKVLMSDPRPGYQNKNGRKYGFQFGNMEVKFVVNDGVLKVVDIW